MLTTSIVETIEHQEWVIREWRIKFLLSEKLLHQIKKASSVDNWYEDPALTALVMDKLEICLSSIKEYYNTFGSLPYVGDRLFDEDSGLLIQERSIDGRIKTLTFTLTT